MYSWMAWSLVHYIDQIGLKLLGLKACIHHIQLDNNNLMEKLPGRILKRKSEFPKYTVLNCSLLLAVLKEMK